MILIVLQPTAVQLSKPDVFFLLASHCDNFFLEKEKKNCFKFFVYDCFKNIILHGIGTLCVPFLNKNIHTQKKWWFMSLWRTTPAMKVPARMNKQTGTIYFWGFFRLWSYLCPLCTPDPVAYLRWETKSKYGESKK